MSVFPGENAALVTIFQGKVSVTVTRMDIKIFDLYELTLVIKCQVQKWISISGKILSELRI